MIDASAKLRAKIRNPRLITRVAGGEDMLTGGPNLRNYFEVGESALAQIKAGRAAAGVVTFTWSFSWARLAFAGGARARGTSAHERDGSPAHAGDGIRKQQTARY